MSASAITFLLNWYSCVYCSSIQWPASSLPFLTGDIPTTGVGKVAVEDPDILEDKTYTAEEPFPDGFQVSQLLYSFLLAMYVEERSEIFCGSKAQGHDLHALKRPVFIRPKLQNNLLF